MVQPPKTDGPPPKGAPQNFNSTQAIPALDPVEDSFPISIRGRLSYPDVPEDQLVPRWFIGDRFSPTGRELQSWVASAPENAYRFRQYNEFESKGQAFIEKMRKFNRAPATVSPNEEPFREAYLTRMNPDAVTPPRSLETIMERAVQTTMKHTPHISPLAVQRDVGRHETAPRCADKIKPDAKVFPFSWKTEDWYEYEVAKVRTRRFHLENLPTPVGSEVTYRLVIEGQWDHHAERMAEDVAEFIREVGKQVVEEKLVALRRTLAGLRSGRPVESDLLEVLPPHYTPEEAADFVVQELEMLEQQCLTILGKCAGQPASKDRYDAAKAWPHVEHLEPWKRMAEYWGGLGDRTWTHMERSVQKVEFRRFFRIVVVKMPFVSLELEKRLYDIRHWAHRACTIEYQTIFKKNLVYDRSVFPVEHDPVTPHTHENHRLFSFALDWQEAPAGMQSIEGVRADDTWDTVATRIGTTTEALKEANPAVEELQPGLSLHVPASATKAVASFGNGLPTMRLVDGGKRLFNTWDDVAKVLECDAEDLKDINADYCDDKGELIPEAEEIQVPLDALLNAAESEFAKGEFVLAGDDWDSIARRLGCTVEELKGANKDKDALKQGSTVTVPPTATLPRRMTDPLLLYNASQAVTNRLRGEMKQFKLEKGIPAKPEAAESYPYEYMDSTTRYPFIPQHTGKEDWLAYTAAYLDTELSQAQEAVPLFNVNKLWPMQQVPGKVDQTPFEEDQTWFMNHIPVQQQQMFHPEGYLQDLPQINNEMFPKSLDWQAP